MVEVVDGGDVVVVALDADVRVYGDQSASGGLHLTEAGLVRLVEEPVHVGQLHLVVVEQQQLDRYSTHHRARSGGAGCQARSTAMCGSIAS